MEKETHRKKDDKYFEGLKETSLSEKIKDTSFNTMGFQDDAIEVKDVREAVLRLKKFIKPHDCTSMDFDWNISALFLLKMMDEIFGEKFT